MTRRSVLLASGLFAVALLLRVAALDRDRGFTGDESMHVANAHAYAEHGHLGPDNWYHPPLKHLLTYASLRLIGDDPWGWRLRNVVFGAGTVAVLLLLAEALLGAGAGAVTAAVLLMLDPLHLAFSRSTFEDVPATFFLLLGLLLSLRHHRGEARTWPVAAGVSFGLAVALRPWAAGPLLAVTALLGAHELGRGRSARLLGLVAALLVVPLGIYLAAWVPWFRRGYGVGEWLLLQRWALAEATSGVGAGFDPLLLAIGHPWRWFVLPVGIGLVAPGAAEYRVVAIVNDPPVWILVLPSMAALAWWGVRERRWELLAVPATFALLYVPFLLARRPIFLYSSLPLLPLGFIAVGHAARRLLRRWTPAFAALAAAWCLYLYPLATGAPIRPGWYAPVLRWVQIAGRP